MIDTIFENRPKRHVRDLNIVPILDMLTTVIFFLLMSTSFMEYTKLTIPPSGTTTVSTANLPPPLAPKMLLGKNPNGTLELLLTWQGEKPGERRQQIPVAQEAIHNTRLLEAGRNLTKELLTLFPKEKTLQIGMESQVPYQNLITLMDGVRENISDVVLISYEESGSLLKAPAGKSTP